MNTLWHFGDSWGTCDKNETVFSKYIANHYGIGHFNYSVPGYSNRSIFEEILKYSNSFQDEDYILINWSYFSRLDCIVLDENDKKKYIRPTLYIETPTDGYDRWILDGSIYYYEEEQYKLFSLINTHLKNLEEKGIRIFYTVQDLPTIHKIDIIGDNLLFDNGRGYSNNNYDGWVHRVKDWEIPAVNGNHYKLGIQEQLANEYIKRMDEFLKPKTI